MKKKKLKNSTEKAFKFVNTLKANAEILHEKGNDSSFITTLETSVQKLDDLEKELVTLKETLDAKKFVFKQEKELTLQLLKNAKDVLKKGEGKKKEPEKEEAEKKENKQQKPEKKEAEKSEVKQPKPEKKQKAEPTEVIQNPEIAVEAEESK